MFKVRWNGRVFGKQMLQMYEIHLFVCLAAIYNAKRISSFDTWSGKLSFFLLSRFNLFFHRLKIKCFQWCGVKLMLVKHEPKIQNNVGNWWLLSAESLIVAKLCRLSTISEPKIRTIVARFSVSASFTTSVYCFRLHRKMVCLITIQKDMQTRFSWHISLFFACISAIALESDFMDTRCVFGGRDFHRSTSGWPNENDTKNKTGKCKPNLQIQPLHYANIALDNCKTAQNFHFLEELHIVHGCAGQWK